jgi:phospholipase C
MKKEAEVPGEGSLLAQAAVLEKFLVGLFQDIIHVVVVFEESRGFLMSAMVAEEAVAVLLR